MSELNTIDEHGVLHAQPITVADACGGYEPNELSYECGCSPLKHQFQCVWCRRIVGWCMGSAHEIEDLPEDLCDACLNAAENAWEIPL